MSRHTTADAGEESEPLFSAELEESRSHDAFLSGGRLSLDGDDGAANNTEGREIHADDERGTRFPPAKYLKSTFASREAEFDLDEDELDEADSEGVPSFRGLLGSAAQRGSIDAHRRQNGRARTDQDSDSVEEELVVGGGKGSILASVSNMSNSILGAGIIGLPYAVREAGFVTGLLLLVVLGIATDWSLRLVVLNAKLTGRKTYIDIMESCFGTTGRAVVSFFQFSFAAGGCCAFAVILGDTLPSVLRALLPGIADSNLGQVLFARQLVVVVATLCVSYPLSLYRDIEKLSKASALALVSMAIIVITVVVEGPTLSADLKGDPANSFTIIDSGFFEAVGVISFAYVCHHNSLLIYGSMSTPTLDRWNTVTHISTGLSVVASLVMAIAGYSVFTDKTRGNILNNFPADHFWANLARLCFGLNMMTTTPLEIFVCREVFENYFYRDQAFDTRRHFIVTTVLVISSMSISLLTCDLGLVLEITGSFGAVCLAYIFPAACLLKLSNDRYARSKWPAWASVVFGLVVMVLATSLAVIKSGSKPHKVC